MKTALTKALCILLALCALASLTACGGKAPAEPAGDTAAEAPAEAPAAQGEVRTLTFTSSANSNETQGKFVQRFCDNVKEATNGAIEFTVYFGGTLCGEEEELQYVQDGSVDMAALAHTDFPDDLTCLQFPYCVVGDVDELCNYYDDVLFENEETSALIDEQCRQAGVKVLGYMYCGRGAFVSRIPASSLHDLEGKKFGICIPGAWEDYGVSCVNLVPPDAYDALSRGVVDATCCSFAPCYEMCWYEVADHWILYGDISVGNLLTINEDTWNSLSGEEQAIFRQAAVDARDFSVELNNEIEDGYLADLEERGCTLSFPEGEDQQFYFSSDFRLNARNGLEYAAKNDCVENMKTILAVGADRFGIDISDILAEY